MKNIPITTNTHEIEVETTSSRMPTTIEYPNMINDNSDIYKVEYEKKLPCKILANTSLCEKKNIKITLSKPEKHSGGFFTSAYTTFLVKTDPFGFQVRRRYSDFEWLRNLLCLHFPGINIPPIPSKKYSDRFLESFVLKRMRYLEVILLLTL